MRADGHLALGNAAGQWSTVRTHRRLLVVVHNVTAATRLLDVLPLVTDPRVQIYFTTTGSSAFDAGTTELLDRLEAAVLPWEDAVQGHFDLALTASYGGDLHRLETPLAVVPHGIGYNKYLKVADRKPVFGLSAEWLLHEGRLVPSVIVLSHEEQLDRLRAACPEAVPAAVVAGDVCLDRILASAPLRWAFRDAFGVSGGQRLVLVSSTWGPESLFGQHPDLVRRLAEALPVDDYRVAVALHPAIWAWHSPWQIRAWLSDCTQAGVLVLPPEEGWRAAIVAADLTIGDHGSVSFYAATAGCPLALAARPADAVDPDSAVGRLLTVAPAFDPDGDLRTQVQHHIDSHEPVRLAPATDLATSVPGGAGHALQEVLYRQLRLSGPFPDADPVAVPIPDVQRHATGAHVVSVGIDLGGDHPEATVTRFAASALSHDHNRHMNGHLVIDVDQPRRRWLRLAEIVVNEAPHGDAAGWMSAALAALPGCSLATAPLPDGAWAVRTRDGRTVRFESVPDGVGRVCASVVHGWLTAGHDLEALPGKVSVSIGGRGHVVSVSPLWTDR